MFRRMRIDPQFEYRARVPRLPTSAACDLAWNRFLDSLDDTQRRTVGEGMYFDLRSNTGRLWRILTHTYTGNCYLLDGHGQALAIFCTVIKQPGTIFPLGDHLLAQALMLRTDEDHFIRIGVRADQWFPPAVQRRLLLRPPF